MDIRCPQCDTVYEIDERQLRGGGATFKCSQCDHVFRLQSHASLSQENQRRWMVRNTTSGDILYFSAFDELHQWLLQGKVSQRDEISRTGKKWKPLTEIGEFMPIFQAVESISNINASRAAERQAGGAATERSAESSAPAPAAERGEPAAAEAEPVYRSKVPTSRQFQLDAEPSGREAAAGQPTGLSETSQPQPNATPVDPQRSQTPGASRVQPDSSAAEEPPAAQSQQENAAASQEASKPQVRLQTGAFGSVSEPAEDDEWSFGDASTLGEIEGAGASDSEVEYDPGGSSKGWVAAVVVLVLAAGGASAYFYLNPGLATWLPGAQGEAVVIDETEEAIEASAVEEEPNPRGLVRRAYERSLAEAQAANARLVGEAVDRARPEIAAGVEAADGAARKAAEEPDVDELLASAKRYLESGRPRRARTKYHKALEQERSNVAAITGLGWSLLALGNAGAAAAQFRKALDYNASFGDAYIGLGKAEREQGNSAAALEAYRDYLSRFPGGPKSSIARYQADKLEKKLGQ